MMFEHVPLFSNHRYFQFLFYILSHFVTTGVMYAGLYRIVICGQH